MKRVGVIGTAGRGDAGHLLSSKMFEWMVDAVAGQILDVWKLDPAKIILVSGGSAWSDHVAVHLFLHDKRFAHSQLELFLPCAFSTNSFKDEKSWHKCGNTLNSLHQDFSTRTNKKSLSEIQLAKDRGAKLHFGRGFFARNLQIAQGSDYLVALSFSTGKSPSDGGTAHTWKHAPPTTLKHHIPIHISKASQKLLAPQK